MVKSEQIYSPQSYVGALTGLYFIVSGYDDIEWIHTILAGGRYKDLWDYPLSEIDHIVENKLDVVLVDCMVNNPETDELEHVYRWFEVPEDFKEEE